MTDDVRIWHIDSYPIEELKNFNLPDIEDIYELKAEIMKILYDKEELTTKIKDPNDVYDIFDEYKKKLESDEEFDDYFIPTKLEYVISKIINIKENESEVWDYLKFIGEERVIDIMNIKIQMRDIASKFIAKKIAKEADIELFEQINTAYSYDDNDFEEEGRTFGRYILTYMFEYNVEEQITYDLYNYFMSVNKPLVNSVRNILLEYAPYIVIREYIRHFYGLEQMLNDDIAPDLIETFINLYTNYGHEDDEDGIYRDRLIFILKRILQNSYDNDKLEQDTPLIIGIFKNLYDDNILKLDKSFWAKVIEDQSNTIKQLFEDAGFL